MRARPQSRPVASAATLQIQFDANQGYQLDAVRAVVELFNGRAREDASFELSGNDVVANLPADVDFDRRWLLSNLQEVQERRGIDVTPGLVIDSALSVEGVANDSWDHPSFTIEMETGTGKTYVYLRTIHELRRAYGFRKYVVVVPSVAIYEGVAKNFDITRAHFASLYGNEPIHLIQYDGARVSTLREFATSSFCEILLITLDSFNKQSNVIYNPSDSLQGERLPHQFIQETRPILIMDEPQNMESKLARSAIATLHPLFALRYSATHRTSPNLVYRLTPFDAFRQDLVKRIQVSGVTDSEDANRPLLTLGKITKDGAIRATVRTHAYAGGKTREQEFILKVGDDLYSKTKRDEHKGGYVVQEIHRGEKALKFENGLLLREGDDIGHSKPEVFRAQIRETIQRHMETQEYLIEKGIKVLSLFFIDRVANYTQERGIVKEIFDREFRRLRHDYAHFDRLEPKAVREAYFASKKKPKSDEIELIDIALDETKQRKEDREAAKRAYALIMREKERLLSLKEPVAFIFAHSALKEGWDNPNVFQICTLNQTTSETKKRQEIGRGLRLCVNQSGERVAGDEINVLTVIANQSYHSYAQQLQQEYVEEGQENTAPPAPTNAVRAVATRNDSLYRDKAKFGEIWRRLSQRLRYDIEFDTDELVRRAVERLNAASWPEPRIVVQRGDYVIHHYQLRLLGIARGQARIKLDRKSSDGRDWDSTRSYGIGDDLAKIHDDERLRGFRVLRVAEAPRPSVMFENAEQLDVAAVLEYASAAGQLPREQVRFKPDATHPVFNVIDRAQRETRLTRATINRIFRGLASRVQKQLFRNPEGWAGEFISGIRECVADLVSESLTFRIDGDRDLDLEGLFPQTKRLAQKELIDAGKTGLYDRVQKDSGVEEAFVAKLRDDRSVELYFKFPPTFKVDLPRIVGKYNPDWGIVRRGEDGTATLHLVRETKGTEDLKRLRFPHEKRKITCAQKYFETAGVDYRVVSDRTPEWWKAVESLDRQLDLAEDR